MTRPPKRYSGTVNTVKEGSPATLSSSNTHPSFLGRERPLPCGSSVPLARAPNPLERERALRLTNSARRLQERDSQHCVRTPQRKMYSRFLPSHRRRCSKQDFLCRLTSTCLRNQERSHCSTEGQSLRPSCANQSRHVLSLFRLGYKARIQTTP